MFLNLCKPSWNYTLQHADLLLKSHRRICSSVCPRRWKMWLRKKFAGCLKWPNYCFFQIGFNHLGHKSASENTHYVCPPKAIKSQNPKVIRHCRDRRFKLQCGIIASRNSRLLTLSCLLSFYLWLDVEKKNMTTKHTCEREDARYVWNNMFSL